MATSGGTPYYVAASFRAITTPPVSGTAYQTSAGLPLFLTVQITLATTLAADTATATLSVSPDGITYTTVETMSISTTTAVVDSQVDTMVYIVPANWYYKVTSSSTGSGVATIGVATGYA